MTTRIGWLIAGFACTSLALAGTGDTELASLLKERVELQRWATGIVLGITTPEGHRVVAYGRFGLADARPVSGDTVFEIASITKIFTSLLLADMANSGEVSMHAPVAGCLGSDIKLPTRGGKQITFIDLATHTSGLPLRPSNLAAQPRPGEGNIPGKYAAYTRAQMYQGLAAFQLDRDIGSDFEYSNWGFGLLGDSLAGCAKVSYDSAIRSRITQPLGMPDTMRQLSASMQIRAATGYDEKFQPVAHESVGEALEGAGGLFSTAHDLLVFLDAFLGRKPSKLDPAITSMLDERRSAGYPELDIGLGWRIETLGGAELNSRTRQMIVWSNGRSDGFRSFIGFNPRTKIGVVALANAASNLGAEDIARVVLGSTEQPVRFHRRIKLSAAVLDRYVGRYRFDDGAVTTFVRDGTQLVSHRSDGGGNLLYPETQTAFYPQDVEVRIEFDPPVAGKSPSLTLLQDGVSYKAKRME